MPIKFLNNVAVDSNVLYVDAENDRVGIRTTTPENLLEIKTAADGSGSEGIFVKDTFAGTSRVVASKDPFISIGAADATGATATLYLGEDGTATGQETKIEYNNNSSALGIFVKGQGTYLSLIPHLTLPTNREV